MLIFRWVANWRPIEIFLYDWWPIVRRRNLYQRLAAAQVELKPYKNDDQGLKESRRVAGFSAREVGGCPYVRDSDFELGI